MTDHRTGGRDGFRHLLRAEWTKFRTVRGWVAGMAVAVALVVALGLLSASGSHASCGMNGVETACTLTTGPGGEAVSDRFFFVHRRLDGDGSITVRVNSMAGQIRLPDAVPGTRRVVAGVVPWAKAGIMVKDGVRQGASYAAVMVTARHGVRMQHDFTGDVAGTPGGVSPGSPRWLRLTRSGGTLTGYESVDGRRWTVVGTARPAALPATVEAGMFVASPGDLTVSRGDLGGASVQVRFTEATAVFDQVRVEGRAGGTWSHDDVGVAYEADGRTPHHPGRFAESGGTFTITGVGDIAPSAEGTRIESTLTGLVAGLIAVIVVAVSFVTAEQRRGLIRTTFLAAPRRGRVVAAKALVVGAVAFAAGLAAAGVTVPVGTRILRANGNAVLPVSTLTELRVVAGAAMLTAAVAVLALACGVLLRRGAAAVTAVAGLVVVPHILATASVLPLGVAQWLLRLTPAAGFAAQQSVPEYAQVLGYYSPQGGYYPLPPLAGLAVLCGYAALAAVLAVVRTSRRDA
ncbi:ABC transporter permease subunit [Microbispora sp. GKU 823]|uniref:ABC transporter permease subunit n=1 Tax=Microbispora sp. GKU 823 TaxID=1652100 RepID=UPI0009A3D406|nr:ABC transporter permease subunit [Microbispora sp. GKU 823]OPG08382.1 hypothetical protein B1L11_28185 [Microbispora sp. GKU 823]